MTDEDRAVKVLGFDEANRVAGEALRDIVMSERDNYVTQNPSEELPITSDIS